MGERLVFGYGTAGHRGEAPSRQDAPTRRTASTVEGAAVAQDLTPTRRDWAFMGLLAFTAMLFFRPQDHILALQALHLAEVAAIIGLIAMVTNRLSRGMTISRITPELVGVVALGGVILITAPFSVWMGGAISTFTELFLKVMLIFALMVNTLLWPKRIDRFTWLIVLATGYIASRAVFDHARGINLVGNGRVRGAVGGMFENPNDLALNMVAVLPLALSFVFRRVTLLKRGTAAACAFLMVMTIVASRSRSGALGLAAAIIVMALLTMKRKPGLVAAGVLVAVMALPMLPGSYWHRIASITDDDKDETGSREARSTLLRESYRAFLENPITGVGAGQFKNYKPEGRVEAWRESHNALLQVAAELGLLGVGVFGFLLWCGFYAPIQTRRLLEDSMPRRGRGQHSATADPLPPGERELLFSHSAAISAAFAGWFVCSLFASVAYHWTLYYLLALALAPREYLADRLMPIRRPRRATVTPPAVAEARA